MNCSVCDATLPDGARFCPNCGAVVAAPLATEERKVVTVLFADLVNSTGLAQRLDPERSREVLGRFFDAATEELRALRGRPEKFIGDAVMAVFGLPTVHEDDALRAVRAGLAILGRLVRMGDEIGLGEPLEVRIGIETGEAATGIGPAGQLLVTGRVVNAAARLQSAAQPGEILVGATTFALTQEAVSYGERREVAAKGFDEPLPGFAVDRLSRRSARRTIPFVGRTSELTILEESFARVSAKQRPVLVTILGESGMGKTRLADELIAGLDDGVHVLTGRNRSYADEATFAPAAAMVAQLAGVEITDDREVTRRKLVTALADDPSSSDAVVDGTMLLLEKADPRDGSTFVTDIHAGFIGLIDRVSTRRPLVLVFDDAHALEAPMLDLIERLGGRARHGRRSAMIIVLARSELLRDRPTWGSRATNGVLLRLDPLTAAESIDLARKAAGGRLGDPDAATIAERAGGNPFFIIESTGMLVPGEGAAGQGSALPPTVRAVVSARLDALPTRLRDLARRAAIFVVSFDLDELRIIVPEADEAELEQLAEAEIVVRGDEPHDAHWRLRHSTLKDVAYASLPKRERARLHGQLADWLLARDHPSWAAEHLAMAAEASLDLDPDDRTIPDRAVDALVAAGDRARRRMENRTSVDHYDRALALAGSEDRWGVREARALAGKGEAHYWLAEYPASSAALDRAVDLGETHDDPFALALALRFLGDIAINVEADLERAEVLLDRSLAAAERLGDAWAIVRTVLFAGWVPWTRERHDEAEAIWRRALETADPEDGWARVRALNCLSINRTGDGPLSLERPDDDPLLQALELSDRASALAQEIGDPVSIAMTTEQRARVLDDLGRPDESLPCLDDAIATFEELGARWETGDALAERGIVKRELGRLDEAEDDLWSAIRISEELGERQLATWTWRALARISERRGDLEEAKERSQRAEEAIEAFTRPRQIEVHRR